jgi:hypothetical protein
MPGLSSQDIKQDGHTSHNAQVLSGKANAAQKECTLILMTLLKDFGWCTDSSV